MTSVAVRPREAPAQYSPPSCATAETIARDAMEHPPMMHYYGSPSRIQYVPNVAVNVIGTSESVPKSNDAPGGTTLSIIPSSSIPSAAGLMAHRVVYSPQTGLLGTSQSNWTQSHLYPSRVSNPAHCSNLGPPNELLTDDSHAWAVRTTPTQIARQTGAPSQLAYPKRSQKMVTNDSAIHQGLRGHVFLREAVAPSRFTSGPAATSSSSRSNRDDATFSSSYTRSSSDSKDPIPFEQKAQELRQKNEIRRANRALMHSAYSCGSDSASSPTFPSRTSTKSLSSENWELGTKLMPVTRSGPTAMPPHIQSRNPGFKTHPVSPLLLFYYDESAPNDVLLAHDVRPEQPLRGGQKFIKRMLTCAGGRSIHYRVPGEGYSEILSSNLLSVSSMESQAWRSKVQQPRPRGLFSQACCSRPTGDAVGRFPSTSCSRLSGSDSSTYGDEDSREGRSSSGSGSVSVYSDSSGTLSSSYGSQRAAVQSRYAIAAAPAPYAEAPYRGHLLQPSVVTSVARRVTSPQAYNGHGSTVVALPTGGATPPAWATIVSPPATTVMKAPAKRYSTQLVGAPPRGAVVSRRISSEAPPAPKSHEASTNSPPTTTNPQAVEAVSSTSSSGMPRYPGDLYYYPEQPLSTLPEQPLSTLPEQPLSTRPEQRQITTETAAAPRRPSEAQNVRAVCEHLDGSVVASDPIPPGTMKVRCPNCNGKGYYLVPIASAGSSRSKAPTNAASRWCNCCNNVSVAERHTSVVASSRSSAVASVVASAGSGVAAQPRHLSAPSVAAASGAAANSQPRRKRCCGGCCGSADSGSVISETGGSAGPTTDFEQPEAVAATSPSAASEATSSVSSGSKSSSSSYTSDETETPSIAATPLAGDNIIRYQPNLRPERERDLTYTVRKMFCEIEKSADESAGELNNALTAQIPAGSSTSSSRPTGGRDISNPFGMCPSYSVSYRHYPRLCYDVITPTNYADFFRVRVPPVLMS